MPFSNVIPGFLRIVPGPAPFSSPLRIWFEIVFTGEDFSEMTGEFSGETALELCCEPVFDAEVVLVDGALII